MPVAGNQVSVARRFLFVVCSVLLVATVLTTSPPSVLGQGTWASGEQEGEVLPTPPKQSAAWTPPPTKLPTTLVSAAEHLFQLGLADPRGCEYREIEVLVGGYPPERADWEDSVVKTHGWVIPATRRQPRQFGVCWDGLVYPLLSVGKTADLQADALAAAKAEARLSSGSLCWMGSYEGWLPCNTDEARVISHQSRRPIKVCLLLRLGETELAEKLWNRWSDALLRDAQFRNDVTASQRHVKDPYFTLANCWAGALYGRAKEAHVRGDDGLALAAAETLAKVGPALKAEAQRRGLSPSGMEYSMLSGDFDCDGILADQRRRARERREKSAPAVRAGECPDPAEFWEKFRQALDRCPDKAQRIAFLIRQFEEVSSLQEPLGLSMAADVPFSGVFPSRQHPISRLLAAQGDEAVEPLLACLEKDDRLTRWQPFLASYPVGVRVLAKEALEQTLKLPLPEFEGQYTQLDSEEDGLETPQAMAARLRAYWQRYKNVPPVERWYVTLADDQARDRWLVAARTIVQPASVPVTLDSVQNGFREDFVPHTPGGQRMYGEPLREKVGPSVTELMIKRVEALDEPFNQLLAGWRSLGEQERELNERQEKLEKERSRLDPQFEQLYKQQWQLHEQQEQIRGGPRAQDPLADRPQTPRENSPGGQQGESSARRLKDLKEQEDRLVALIEKLNKRYEGLTKQLEDVDTQWNELLEQQAELSKREEELYWREFWQDTTEGRGGDMAVCLAKWDPAAAIPVLRQLTLTTDGPGELRAGVHDWGGVATRELDHYYAGLLIARIDVGDTTALDQYAAWIRGAKREDIEYTGGLFGTSPRSRHQIRRLLAPLWQYPDHPAIAATTEWLFNGEGSPWNPIVSPRKTAKGRIDGSPLNSDSVSAKPPDGWTSVEPLRGPLMPLTAFRRQVARLLEDRREAGQVEVVSNEEIRTGVENGRDPTRSTVPDDPLCPPPGTKAAFRICDVCAYGLSLNGAPKCELFWPQKERDRAVEACAGYLRQYGDHLRLVPQSYAFGNPYHVQLVLPILDRPATPEDVRRGDAVFSLAGQGTVRVCKMPRLPLAARWTTQTDYPVLRDEWDDEAHTYKKVLVGYDRDGIVWQAEEVRSGGRWQRYYGFVGCHGLAKVPAEEIEFPWTGIYSGLPADANVLNPMPLDDAFDIGWTAPGPGAVFTIGDPLVCRMLVRNHSAMERTLPPLATGGDHARPAGDAVTIDTQLCWMHPLAYWGSADTPAPWTPLVPKKPERLILNRLQRPLGPGEQFEILRCDLNEQFGPLRAGLYGFQTKLVRSKETRSQEQPDVFFQLIESEPTLSPGEAPW